MQRVAYLVSKYPALSHAFVEREIRALRAAGVDVTTHTVRPAGLHDARSEYARSELSRTRALLGSPARSFAGAHLRAFRRSPMAWLGTLARAAQAGDRTVRNRVWQLFYFAEAGLLWDRLREDETRHVHVHFANNGADVARLAIDLGRRIDGPEAGWTWSLAMHGPAEFDAVDKWDLPAKLEDADFVACISDFCRGQVMRLTDPSSWSNFSVVHMTVDTDAFPAMSERRSSREAADLRILFVGRLVPAKGPSQLLDVIARWKAEEPWRRIELALVGDGPLLAPLRRQVEALGLSDVHLPGGVGQDDLPEWYEWADVFCLPSFAEGVPVVLMEAMATELPVVTTRIAGIPELVEDGQNGLLISPGRHDQLLNALRALADDPERRQQLGRAGRRRTVESFHPSGSAARLINRFAEGTMSPSREPVS